MIRPGRCNAYRGDTLALTVTSIGWGARHTVKDNSCGTPSLARFYDRPAGTLCGLAHRANRPGRCPDAVGSGSDAGEPRVSDGSNLEFVAFLCAATATPGRTTIIWRPPCIAWTMSICSAIWRSWSGADVRGKRSMPLALTDGPACGK